MSVAVAAALLGVAVILLSGGRSTPRVVRLRLSLGVSGWSARDQSGARATEATDGSVARKFRWLRLRVLPVVMMCLIAVIAGSWAGPVGVVACVLALPLVRVWRRRRAREHRRRTNSAAVADACLVIGSELAAGGSAQRAMAAAANEWPELFGSAAGRMTVGDDPVPALRDAASHPGAEAMSAVAAAWEVAERSGARAAIVLRVVADSIRDEAAARHEAESQLMTVRTTARMLAALPVITLVVFSGGLEPVRFLVGSLYGLACLAGASLLLAAGLAWVGVVHRDATRSVWQR